MALPPEAEGREQEADRAFSRGDLSGAEATFAAILDQFPERIDSWLKLATIRRALSDSTGALEAISGALRADPLHFMALLSRAHLLESLGQQQEAARSYAHALAQLPQDEPIPPHLQKVVAHARTAADEYQREIEATWDKAIAVDEDLPVEQRRKLDRFKSNALRRTRVYHCEPTHYHYPGLPEHEFHPRSGFPWLAELEAATPVIERELRTLLARDDRRAEPYIQYSADMPVRQWAELNHSMDWTAFHLLHGGRLVPENAPHCPQTLALLEKIGQPNMAGRSPNAMFSLLRPHTRIPPHTGVSNTRLVCHLPLIVPPGCRFRVGAQTRAWTPGEAFVFDDTIEHEAANDSDTPRIVLIFDVWHPALDASERQAITRVMEAEQAAHGFAL